MPLRIEANEAPQATETDVDRYPTLAQALAELEGAITDDQLIVDRVEMSMLANGDINCKWWSPRAEEPEFVFIPSGERT